jgi:bifunctional non-homologous end joining protein LigD
MGVAQLIGARHSALPAFVEPQRALLVGQAPDGDEWLHELKLDGYRMLARIAGNDVRLLTRSGKDWTARLPELEQSLGKLGLSGALLDGEVVVLRDDGISDFQLLQNRLGSGDTAAIVYFAFDVLHSDGFDLTRVALEQRKLVLERELAGADPEIVRYADHVVGNGGEFFRRACQAGLEGIVSKPRGEPYRAGERRGWLKTKCAMRQEFVIGGYTKPAGTREHLGALLVGVRRGGALVYSGKVGTGFSRRSLTDLSRRLSALRQPAAPFADPPRGADARDVVWVRPELVAEVEFIEFTRDGMLRHPTFRGLREDKSAAHVHRERPRA